MSIPKVGTGDKASGEISLRRIPLASNMVSGWGGETSN